MMLLSRPQSNNTQQVQDVLLPSMSENLQPLEKKKQINTFSRCAASNIEWAKAPLPPTSCAACGSLYSGDSYSSF